MKARQAAILIVLAVLAAIGGYLVVSRMVHRGQGNHLTVYYTKQDGTTLGAWTVSVRPKQPGESNEDQLHDLVLYAAVQAIAGPSSEVQAVRFPAGTRVLGVSVNGSTATVDLSKEVTSQTSSFEENGEFKSLVYSVTGIPPISSVQVTIDGHVMGTLPGGHLELDTPLRRSDW
jgi:spore germination protein GerM